MTIFEWIVVVILGLMFFALVSISSAITIAGGHLHDDMQVQNKAVVDVSIVLEQMEKTLDLQLSGIESEIGKFHPDLEDSGDA